MRERFIINHVSMPFTSPISIVEVFEQRLYFSTLRPDEIQFAKLFAVEWALRDVHVNSIRLGYIGIELI